MKNKKKEKLNPINFYSKKKILDKLLKIFSNKIDEILDLEIIKDKQLGELKIEILNIQGKLRRILNKKIIDYPQIEQLDKYKSNLIRKKSVLKYGQKFSDLIKRYKLKDLKFINFKPRYPKFINPKSLASVSNNDKPNMIYKIITIYNSISKKNLKSFTRINLLNFEKIKKLEKTKYKKYFNKNLSGKNSLTFNLRKFKFVKKEIFKTIKNEIKSVDIFSNLIADKSNKVKDIPEYIASLYYSDHSLFIAKIWKSKEKVLIVEKVIELPVPSTVIGDDLITNIDELIELSLDSFEVLDLKNPPILIVLPSSFFSIKSFKNNIEKEIAEEDELIQSKSPYLPQDTLIDINKSNENSFNVIYTRKSLINGWVNTLKKINYPVIGITTPGPHQIEFLRENKKIINNLEIIIDIEQNTSTIFIFNKNFELNSQRIPYGSNLYKKKELVESYFSRLTKSIKLITNDLKVGFPEKVYVSGFGLDDFDYSLDKLPYPFVRFSELNNPTFKFNKTNSEELINKNIDAKLNTVLGITSKCL